MMVETDWKEILSFSQKELKEADKEKLCESLSWMEPDDIELNFADIKTLFRLAQDMLKFKNEQVKNLAAQIGSSEKKSKGKSKKRAASKSEEYLETIAHQEEVIKENKEIIETLQAELAELEAYKKKSMEGQDVESESSRSVLSELNALRELENEVSSKNRHIRKLIGDIKLLENENTAIKEKTSVLKDKLTEATLLIENLTQRLFSLNNDNEKLKDLIGAYEETKTTLNFENEILKKELLEKESTWDNVFEEIQAKVQRWKNVAKSSRTEILNLASENEKLKESLQVQGSRSSPKSSPKKSYEEKLKIKELQEKLSQATSEIFSSANLIENLSKENKKLKSCLEEMPDYSVSDTKNESDEGKERALIIKLKREIKSQNITMRGMEDMISEREKELTEIASQLQLLQSDDGIKKLLSSLKFKTKQIQSKDQGIKTLVQEINTLSQDVDNLQIENKILRDKLNIQPTTDVPSKGILKKYNDMEKLLGKLQKERTSNENKITDLELHNRELTTEINKFTEFMLQHGFSSDIISTISHNSEEILKNVNADLQVKQLQDTITKHQKDYANQESELKEVIEQNEGLRKSLSELLNFLKDNSSTTSGVLALECPSLEAVLKSMEARNTAGWFAPHMSTMIELREAKGGRDALLTALHDARKETFDIMNKLSSKSQKCSELEQKLLEMNQTKENEHENTVNDTFSIGEFGSWMLNDDETNRDLYNEHTIENIIIERNSGFEKQLQSNLLYFNNKFEELYQKMTAMAIQATNDQNNWNIQEEQYRAEIEKLKMFIQDKEDSDMSENSPGIVSYPNTSILQRKCSYLQESYKYCKALHENLKNEFTEFKIESIKATVHYEIDIQKLLLTINKLNDKLRNSVTFELFKKQNIELNETAIKYREIMESNVKNIINSQNIAKLLESNKAEIIDQVYKIKSQSEGHEQTKFKNILNDVELSVLQNQLKQVCQDLEKKEEELRSTQSKLVDLQNNYGTIIDQTLGADNTSDSNFLKEENQKLTDQNAILKEQCRHQQNQLNIALIQLQDSEHKQLNFELEINMLKHQILDLQSTGDNKAIIARLSNEVLVAHLQATENYTKIERLNALLRKEKEMRVETEDMLQTRERVFEVYSNRYESKFKYMYELMHILRQQYQGCLPLLSIENYFNNYEECCRKTISVNAKLNEIDDLKDNLMTKHSIYDHVLEASNNKCLDDEDVCCHKLQLTVAQGTRVGELEHLHNKISSTEKSRDKLLKYCNHLEKTLVFLSQGYERSDFEIHGHKKNIVGTRDYVNKLEIEDVQSDDDSSSRKSQTVSLPKPLLLKPSKSCIDMTNVQKEEVPNLLDSPSKTSIPSKPEIRSIMLQTSPVRSVTRSKNTQTDEDHEVTKLRNYIEILENDKQNANEEIMKVNNLNKQLKNNLNEVKHEKDILQSSLRDSQRLVKEKEQYIQNLKHSLEHVQRQADKLHDMQLQEIAKSNETNNDEDNSLLMIVKQLEEEKQEIISEYKKLLQNERDEFSNAVKELQQKIFELQSNSNKKSEPSVASDNLVASVSNKYSQKIAELEHKCFKIQSELDVSSTELQSCRCEMERWKSLAGDRLLKLESLNSQLESRHTQEVDSYKAENQHWLSQLNESQREHTELRTRLSEQKSAHVKTIAEKDAHIDHLRSVINNLKTQILNMQTVISVNDPSFDLSAIVEVEEVTDAASQYGSDRLEIKFDSSEEFHDGDGILKPQASSTVIWQEPVIDRLRREKQQASKQNAILRRQIKALAARERRARLDAQNLKHQVFRISTSGKKLPTVELSTLHSKIASLQTQLTSARRDTQSSIALWDKWKRAQQSSDRWQSRFEEKSQEVRKLEAAMNLARGAVSRLEKEKRVLLQRLTEATNLASDNPLHHILSEKQDGELSEKSARCEECARAPVSARALLDRVEAQQRRIAALEIAERGNEYLVSEYEKSLAEVASLKGQVLKLESALLESQIQVPIRSKDNSQPELEYWKSYCEMLKEENVQLTLRVNSMDSSHLQPGQHKISDLEQTVLTLRGLVSKLQAEQKSGVHRRIDSRPSSGISTSEKSRSQLESHRIEIANLKRSIQDKDLLLERSKEMLKIAADREDELLRENTMLRRRLEELIKPPSGFLSA